MSVKDFVMDESIRILSSESKLFRNNTWCIPELFHKNTDVRNTIEKLYNATWQILEVAKSSSVLRVYNKTYNLTDEQVAYESVGAHTNLVATILDRVIRIGWGSAEIIEDYGYAEIMEAIRRHDLPENVIGDIADNGARDDEAKSREEHQYWKNFTEYSVTTEDNYETRVQNLLDEMEQKNTIMGRLLYLADKIAANIITLTYDSISKSPIMHINSKYASSLDYEAMLHCEDVKSGYCKASEMWTYNYLVNREQINYDDTGFYTAILVMATLIVNGEWYKWRERQYTHS